MTPPQEPGLRGRLNGVDALLGGILMFSLGCGLMTSYLWTTHHPTFAANLAGARAYEQMRREIPTLRAEVDWLVCWEQRRRRTWASWSKPQQDCPARPQP